MGHIALGCADAVTVYCMLDVVNELLHAACHSFKRCWALLWWALKVVIDLLGLVISFILLAES